MSEPIYHDRTSAKTRTDEIIEGIEGEEVSDERTLSGKKKVRVQLVERRRWVRPILWVIIGFLLNMVLVVGLVWWLIGSSPAPLATPTASNSAAASDLNVRVGQDYINREIGLALKQNPLNAFNLASISGLQVAFQPNSQMLVTVRLNAFGRDFDFNFADTVAAVNQKVVLTQAGDVKLAILGLPLSALNDVVKQVNVLVEDQINEQVGAGKPGDCLTCTNLGRVPTLKSLTTEVGTLVAQFDITIK